MIGLVPGQALLIWPGSPHDHRTELLLPPGSYVRGIEFDVIARDRVPDSDYGWQPLNRQ